MSLANKIEPNKLASCQYKFVGLIIMACSSVITACYNSYSRLAFKCLFLYPLLLVFFELASNWCLPIPYKTTLSKLVFFLSFKKQFFFNQQPNRAQILLSTYFTFFNLFIESSFSWIISSLEKNSLAAS